MGVCCCSDNKTDLEEIKGGLKSPPPEIRKPDSRLQKHHQMHSKIQLEIKLIDTETLGEGIKTTTAYETNLSPSELSKWR